MLPSDNDAVYEFLDSNKIDYERCDHPAVFTCEEAEQLVPKLDGARTKNLFLRDRKGTRHFLVIIRPDQAIDLKALSDCIGSSRLSMASPERLQKHLGVTPGSVSPLALLHDRDCNVDVIIDETIWAQQDILSHPMVNTTTLVISMDALRRMFELTGHGYQVLALPERETN